MSTGVQKNVHLRRTETRAGGEEQFVTWNGRKRWSVDLITERT